MNKFQEYLGAVSSAAVDNPTWREGQAYFNVLNRMYPDIADRIRGTVIDPFHADSIIPEFLEAVEKEVNA